MISVTCPHCGAVLQAPPDALGRRAKCKGCQQAFVLAAPTPAATATPATVPASTTAESEAVPATPVAESPFAFSSTPSAAGTTVSRRRANKSSAGTWLMAAVLLLAVTGAGGWYWQSLNALPPEPPKLPLQAQTLPELQEYRFKLRAPGSNTVPLLEIVEGPSGAQIVSDTGEFVWTPSEEQGPGDYPVVVDIRATNAGPVIGRAEGTLKVEEQGDIPLFESIARQEVAPRTRLSTFVKATDTDLPAYPLRYRLIDVDPKLTVDLDPTSGELVWIPNEEHAGREIQFEVEATEQGGPALASRTTVRIYVTPIESPLQRLITRLQATGEKPGPLAFIETLTFAGDRHVLKFGDEELHVFLLPSADEAQAQATAFRADSAKPAAAAQAMSASIIGFRSDEVIAVYAGSDADLRSRLTEQLGTPFVTHNYVATTTPVKSTLSPADETLLTLYRERDTRSRSPKIFSPFEFAALRKVFADKFEAEHAAELRTAFGSDYDAMLEWLNARRDFKETLFLAFDPEHDDIAAGLTIIKQLKEKFPKQFDNYQNLAIATAVVWDNERRGVYDYKHHADRTHSTMPDGLLNAIDNFQYLVETEDVMQGRIRYVPWEFLIYVCNHKTPAPERQWTLANLLPQRVMFGKCYSDVPYDDEMLRTDSRVCRLGDKPYTLPNILQFGGVCAMQADYAARVGKSLGVPAEYVGGEGSFGGRHAWVMWVELTAATPTKVSFTLQSHGRYRGDSYYVGDIDHPQTGEHITDRDMERQLNSVGTNAAYKRQADLAMLAFPFIRDELKLDTDAQFDYLANVTKLSPWNEAAWLEVANIAEDKGADKKGRTQMLAVMDQLFKTFAGLPDYSLVVFPQLVQFEPDVKTRIKYYYQLLDVYASAERPDLAFRALLILADILADNQREMEAVQSLAAAVKKYADQGHYVPPMLDRLESLCTTPELQTALLTFYAEFLPLIPERRGDAPSEYCQQMYQRGIKTFQAGGNMQLVLLYQQKLAALQ